MIQAYDVIALTETWLNNIEMDQFKIKGYNMHYVNRNSSKRKSGGILVYINQHTVNVTQCKATQDSIMWLTVQPANSDCHGKLTVGVCYCAPERSEFSNSNKPFWEALEQDLLHKPGTNRLWEIIMLEQGTYWTTSRMGRACNWLPHQNH